MNGGTISGNTAASTASSSSYGGYAGGVYVSGGTFTMNGGTINGNTASSSYSTSYGYGGGIYISSGTFTMNDGTVGGNTASYYGGGVYVSGSGTAFTMSGGAISGNTASTYGGGGIFVNGGTFTMSGGAISGNTASTYGGGVYVYSSGTFTKQVGGVVYGSDANEGLKNTATDGDSYGHAVYVNSSPAKLRNTTAGYGGTLDSAISGSAGGWETPIPATSLQDALSWLDSNVEEGGNYTITVNADEAITPALLSYGRNVNITLNGGSIERIISLSLNGSLFTVNSGVTLTLGNSITLQGRGSDITNTASLVQVNSGGVLKMENGSKISGNSRIGGYAYGGGVYVNGGTFTMSGGEISGNTPTYGGGVYIYSGTFTMSGGKISGNTASTYGGGVYVNGGTFTMSDGEISGNTASTYGGGIFISDSGTFTMSGGTVSGNTASTYGGGVYISGEAVFTKQLGGVIYGSNAGEGLKNTAGDDSYGHAVYVASSPAKLRNRTASASVRLDAAVSGSTGGWEGTSD
jgi:parallel beta-helix repeat protein